MAVSRYFGLPGCGKTTILAMLAVKGVRSGKYTNVYSNVESLKVHGCTYVPFDLFGEYDFRDCLFLIDEAMIECGDRDYKSFSKQKIRAFVMHRHKNSDIVLFCLDSRRLNFQRAIPSRKESDKYVKATYQK